MHIRRCEERDRELYLRLAREFYHSPAVMHPVPDSYFERTFDEMMRSDVYADGFLLEDEDGTCMGYALTARAFLRNAEASASGWRSCTFCRPIRVRAWAAGYLSC